MQTYRVQVQYIDHKGFRAMRTITVRAASSSEAKAKAISTLPRNTSNHDAEICLC